MRRDERAAVHDEKDVVGIKRSRRGSITMVATLCHIIEGRRLLLKKATRGIGSGKWNAPGGKVEAGETPEDGARREVAEETGLVVKDLFYHGMIRYRMGSGIPREIGVYLFSTRDHRGRAKSTPEGIVRWFDVSRLPVAEMWDDDRFWIHLMLERERFDAVFYYDRTNKRVNRFEIRSRRTR